MGSEERAEVINEGRAFRVVDVDDEHGEAVFVSFHLDHCDVARQIM